MKSKYVSLVLFIGLLFAMTGCSRKYYTPQTGPIQGVQGRIGYNLKPAENKIPAPDNKEFWVFQAQSKIDSNVFYLFGTADSILAQRIINHHHDTSVTFQAMFLLTSEIYKEVYSEIEKKMGITGTPLYIIGNVAFEYKCGEIPCGVVQYNIQPGRGNRPPIK